MRPIIASSKTECHAKWGSRALTEACCKVDISTFQKIYAGRGSPHVGCGRVATAQLARWGGSMATGTVKWFNNAKGYGFLVPESGGDDIFIHHSSIQMDGYRTLRAGQPVSFDIEEGPKGLHAMNIRLEGEPSDADTAD